MRARLAWVLVLACPLACHGRTTAASDAGATSPRPAGSAPAPSLARSCDALRADEGIPPDADESDDHPPKVHFWCDPGGSGWAARLDEGPPHRFTILHRDAGGTVRRVQELADWEQHLFVETIVHDFDGDGSPELFLVWQYEAGADAFVLVRAFVSYKHGSIEPYAPAKDLPVLHGEDVDGDGRPDLSLQYEIGRGRRCDATVDGETYDRVQLVAHTLPDGTFSLTDPVARAAFAHQYGCPTRPATAVAVRPADQAIDEDRIVCARMWGASTDAILGEVDRLCSTLGAQTRACRGPCRFAPAVRRYAAFNPPATFGRE